MLARHARRLLYAELILLALFAVWLRGAGWGWATAIGAVLLCSVTVRAGIMLAGFALSTALHPQGGPALSIGARLRLLAGEFASTMLAFIVLLPFPQLAGSANPALTQPGRRLPVLLVHGYICNRGIWRSMRRFLQAQGIAVWTHDLEPVYAGIDDYVAAIGARIEAILDATGAAQVVVVAHSMGGLVMRAYLRRHGAARMARLITLGTPHHGTRLAMFGLGANARQMRPGSAWLEELARSESAGPKARVTSIWSSNDNIVAPQESARLEGSTDVPIAALGHVRLVFDHGVQQRVLIEIQQAHGA
jgi:pimeloyl-ACP methyl ester carboxylesterase